VVLGSIAIPVGLSVPMKLGLAGGPLIVAIPIGLNKILRKLIEEHNLIERRGSKRTGGYYVK